jgi:hypothetical protein
MSQNEKIELIENIMNSMALSQEPAVANYRGPYYAITIITQILSESIDNNLPYEKHLLANVIEPMYLEKLRHIKLTHEDVAAAERKRSANRNLLQEKLIKLIDEKNLSVDAAKEELRRACSIQITSQLNQTDIAELETAKIFPALDIDYVFTEQRMYAMQSFLTHTNVNAKATFNILDHSKGSEIALIPNKITTHQSAVITAGFDLVANNEEINLEAMIANLKNKIIAGDLPNLELEYLDYVAHEKFLADFNLQLHQDSARKQIDEATINFLNAAIQQPEALRELMVDTLENWIQCASNGICPEAIPLPFILAPNATNTFNDSILQSSGRDADLLNIARFLMEDQNASIYSIIADMIALANGTFSLFEHVPGYTMSLSFYKDPEFIKRVFTEERCEMLIEREKRCQLTIRIHTASAEMITLIMGQPISELRNLSNNFISWTKCYLKNFCPENSPQGKNLWLRIIPQPPEFPVPKLSFNFWENKADRADHAAVNLPHVHDTAPALDLIMRIQLAGYVVMGLAAAALAAKPLLGMFYRGWKQRLQKIGVLDGFNDLEKQRHHSAKKH